MVTTTKGEAYQAEHVLCTLPLGVLQAQSARFSPALPEAKIQAIARMGMGFLSKIFLEFPTRFWPEDINWFLSLKAAAPWGMTFSSLSRVIPNRHILLMWQSGSVARDREALSDEALVKIAMAELRAATGQAVPSPLKSRITRWGTDPFCRGAYFFPKVNSPMTDVAELAKPVGNRLFFAGEATNRGLFGTVPGAILSGRREAERILKVAGG
jgi:monoamine oxidase